MNNFEGYIHVLSPFIYKSYVSGLEDTKTKIVPNNLLNNIKYCYNFFMAVLSLYMLYLVVTANIETKKFYSIYGMLCSSYGENKTIRYASRLFLYSKYIEWLDTLFLVYYNKPVSNLHYYHHMSTAFLTYMNIIEYPSPSLIVFMGSNCLVHYFMYLYYLDPTKWNSKSKKMLTISQIVQHIICLITLIKTEKLNIDGGCQQNKYGGRVAIILYGMYLIHFSCFYIEKYLNKINK